jgi:DMSO/TMAO reductase YedYZ molybdopterin-dependent catalytic subunit
MSDAGTLSQSTSPLKGKDSRLGVLSPRPLVLQTPLDVLAGRRITDARYLYVRNVEDLPDALTMSPLPVQGWEIELGGLIGRSPIVIRAADLVDMAQVDVEMVLQCSGNGRSRFGGAPGTPCGLGGVGNVGFAGVPLAAVLDRYDIRVDPGATFVTAGGKATGAGRAPDGFEHSLPVADVLDRSILALQLNGERLPGVHGGPVRLVTPGYFGTMQVKWLDRLRFETAESTGFYHATEYRVPRSGVQPGDPFQFTLENSRPTWLLQVTSLILDPRSESSAAAGPVIVSGVAFNDGTARLESVQVSFDRGRAWAAAAMDPPESPYAWVPWSIRADLGPGTHDIWSRATDRLGRTQPIDGRVSWNPNGYEWNGVAKVQVVVAG